MVQRAGPVWGQPKSVQFGRMASNAHGGILRTNRNVQLSDRIVSRRNVQMIYTIISILCHESIHLPTMLLCPAASSYAKPACVLSITLLIRLACVNVKLLVHLLYHQSINLLQPLLPTLLPILLLPQLLLLL